jgi:hypothetical protein
MENQHRQIKGYRELSQVEIDLMNEIKAHAEKVGDLFQKMNHMRDEPSPDAPDGTSVPNARWLNIAKDHLQIGFMALTRSVTKPTSF